MRNKIIVADGDSMRRFGILTCLMTHMLGAEVSAELADGKTLKAQISKHRPSLVIVENGLPGVDLEAVIRWAVGRRISKVVCTVGRHETNCAARLTEAGAFCIYRDQSCKEYVRAVKTHMAANWSAGKSSRKKGQAQSDVGINQLTTRQKQILSLTQSGMTASAIGELLGVERRTVESHRYNIALLQKDLPPKAS